MTEDSREGGETTNTLLKTSSQGIKLEMTTYPVQPEQTNQSESERCDPKKTTSCRIRVLKRSFTTIDALFLIGGMILYITDVVTDILVAVQYQREGHIKWSAVTFIFVLLPSVIVQILSFIYFKVAYDEQTDHRMKRFLANLNLCLIHVLQLGVIKRYWSILKFGLRRSNNDAENYLKKKEHIDLYFLRLLQAFMETAPQLVLQVYIMESVEFYWLTPVSTIVSLISLASTIEVYVKLRRDEDPHIEKTYSILMTRIVWRLFTITARVIALVLFASIYKWWVFMLVGAHWVMMTIWILLDDEGLSAKYCKDVIVAALFSIINILCFFLPSILKVGQTRCRATAFYIGVFIENTIMISLWYYSDKESREIWYGLPALFFVWVGFLIGISIFFCLVPRLQTEQE